MKDWRNTLISPNTSIFDTIKKISESSLQIALVSDKDKRLLGTVTDGDIRRAILKNIKMTEPVKKIMHKKYTAASIDDTREKIIGLMESKDLCHIPLLDEKGSIVDLKTYSQIHAPALLDNWSVIMGGGLGKRLRPLTDDFPKPLLKVGDRPLLETIIENCKKYGLYRFFISINYKADMIENYFKDGAQFGVKIDYLREDRQLGTAGALTLFTERPSKPIFVINGDLLTQIDVKRLLDFHIKNKAFATMCVREYALQVPYGVVKTDGINLIGLEEKPVQNFFVNAGIYVLEPKSIDIIPKNTFFNMTTLFEKMIKLNLKTSVFPIHEYWLDVGQIKDYNKANDEFNQIFEK